MDTAPTQPTIPQETASKIITSMISSMPYGFAYHKIIVDEQGKPIDYIFLDCNQKFEEFTGLKKENILNKKVTEVIPGVTTAKPDLISLYGAVALTGQSTEFELYFEPFKKWYTVFAHSPEKGYFLVIISDITKRKEAEDVSRAAVRALQAISKCNEVIIQGVSEQDILQKVCEKIIETTGYRFAWVGYAEHNEEKTVKPVAQAGFEEGYLDTIKITWADDQFGRGPTGLSIRNLQPSIMQNIANNPDYAPWREQAMKRGYGSSACFPFKINGTVGSLCVYATDANAFGEGEVSLLSELAEDLAFGVSVARGRAERLHMASQLQTILSSVSDGVFMLDHEYHYVYINDHAAIMVGKKSAKELEGKILWEIFPEAKNTKYYGLYHEAMEQKKKISFEEYYPPLDKWYTGTIYPSVEGISVFFQDVTERKKVDEKIKKSETELKESQRIGHVGSWDWDVATDKITWSEEYYRIIGLDPATPPPGYQDHLKQYAPESAKRLDEAVQQAMKDGTPYALDLEQIRPNGSHGWIIARGEVIRGKDNKIIGLRGTAQDITERKIAEGKIHKASAYNRNLIETSLDPMLTIDGVGKITDVNKAFEAATGVQRDELIGTDVTKYFTEPEKVTEGLGRTLKEGFIRDYRVAIKNVSTGHVLDCVWNTVVYRDESGGVEGVFAAARDISQLEKVQEALKASEERYKSYIENSSDVVYAVDKNGIFQYLSPQAKKYDLNPEEIVGKQNIAFVMLPEEREENMKAFQQIIVSQKSGSLTFRHKNNDGKIVWLEVQGTTQYDNDGNVSGSIGVARDITERKTAEDRLKELDSIKSRFIRVVSHQMRTPLSAIRWQLESLLSEHDHLSELQKQLIQQSYRANLEIINSINDLITALDIEEGVAVHLDKMPNSLLSLWESIAIEFANECKVKKISYTLTKPTIELPLIDMDTERIRAVMQKLSENALMYTKEGGSIGVKIEKIDSIIRFVISDTGVGIPKDEQKYLFERFYRASNASLMKPDASGLGLYIAKNFVESHGGKIGFVSEEGKGSTFWFEIPVS